MQKNQASSFEEGGVTLYTNYNFAVNATALV